MIKRKGIMGFIVVLLIIGIGIGIGLSIKPEKEPPLEPVDKKRTEIEPYQNIVAVGALHILGVKPDGTVYSWGENEDGQCNTQNWTDIVAVSASWHVSAGLKSDGTVVATGLNDLGQCETSDWRDIIEISASDTHIMGLKSDGTVVATGRVDPEEGGGEETIQTRNEMVKVWKDIKHVVASKSVAIGIKKEGTTIWSDYAAGMPYKNKLETGVYEGWNDIIELKRVTMYWMGLTADGIVKLPDKIGNKTAEEWKNIVDIAAGEEHYAGLKSNGTVVAAGSNEDKQCDVEKWKNILAIYAGGYTTIGLKEDGTLIFSGDSTKTITENPEPGQVDPREWDLF
ncbi:RCC1 domain-containing protein [Anaerosacchariphilus polymeriproducens]|uniref:Chromosome condensation regulator n=1 Tax=Anaerosacchariphilus polymeriproducens TaxID=1812858 RepID=A0A371AZR5_9FIRM|nr:chromosome condensation regulator [Anaerosacchariphilus polymeriproducens]RDU25046.1 chromosome condensation regulator [Anaerosacchariphilus polymeriproducens]